MQVTAPARTAAANGGRKPLTQLPIRDVGGRAVPARLRPTVAEVVLHARGDLQRVGEVVALLGADVGGAHRRGEVGVLAEGLEHAGPHRLAGDVKYGPEVPRDARRTGLEGGDLAVLGHQRHVARGGHRDILREDRRLQDVVGAVDRVEAVEDRDAEARLLRRNVLDLREDLLPVLHAAGLTAAVENRADGVPDDPVAQLLFIEDQVAVLAGLGELLEGQLRHLSDLLLRGHLRHQPADLPIHRSLLPAALAVAGAARQQ